MIGGADEQHRLGRHQQGGGEDCRPGIAPFRLDDDLGIATDLLELLTHQEAVRLDGHDDRAGEDILGGHPLHGLLQARGRAQDPEELLGATVAGNRPEPRTAAAAQDRKTPNGWNYEIKDGKRVPKGNRITNPDGSWREEVRQGNCVTIKEKSATGEYKETRQCNPK